MTRIPLATRLLPLALLASAPLAPAQTHELERQLVPYPVDTGALFAARLEVLSSFEVEVGGAGWLRLFFEELELGGGPLDPMRGRVRITSRADGAVQTLDAVAARQWQETSAYFNGDAVLVELLAGPSAGACRLSLRAVEAGLPPVQELSQCDSTDDRVPSTDPRAGRLLPGGCTGWIFDDCYRMFLTAGHCSDSNNVVQFNVPPSNSGGSINHPPPSDQYAIDPTSLQTNGGQGVGNDWAYFGAFPNTQTGLTPWQAQGAFHSLAAPPTTIGATIRVTGYGVDDGTANQTLQTSTGPLDGLNGTAVDYRADTTGGNSGSPVTREDTGQAVAIHTHGGCSTGGGGANHGTSILISALQNALASPQGVCASAVLWSTEPPTALVPGQPTQLVGRWIADPVPGSGFLRFRAQGGAFQSIPLVDLGGGLVEATLPATACGASPEWYLELSDAACGPQTQPTGAPNEVYSAVVGTVSTVYSDDMQQDLGWSTAVIGATSGFWQRGIPVNDNGWDYDPTSDSDGSGACWLTQNAPGNTDVDNGAVELTSPPLALPADVAGLRYDYFLRLTEVGSDRLRVEVRVEPAGAWTPVALHETDGGLSWRTHEITLTDLTGAGVAPGDTVRLRFTANDSTPQSIVEAGVDALEILAVDCGGGGVGTNVCVSGANGAMISAAGSASIAANNLVLTADGLPANANGVFFHGDGLQQTPFGNGFLCVTGSSGICRLQPVLNSGAAGSIALALDLQAPAGPACSILAGTTRHFQAWFRDGASFDLTDALSIDFVQ